MQRYKIFDASIVLSCEPTIVRDIIATLRDTYRLPYKPMFLKNYFGKWLYIPSGVEGILLLHLLFYNEVVTDVRSKVEEMVFEIEGYELAFVKKE